MGETKVRRKAQDRADGAEDGSEISAKGGRRMEKKRAARDRQMIADAAHGFLSERIARLRRGERAKHGTPAPATPVRGKKTSRAAEPPAGAHD